VSDGYYDLRAVATDALGNATTSSAIADRRVDNTAPTPVTMADPATMRGTVTLSGSATDSGSGVASLVFQRETPGAGANGWITICTVTPPASTCSFNTTAVTDGLYDFRLAATDAAGNVGTSTSWTSRRIDNTAPSGNLSNPGAQLSGTVSVQANATDAGSGIASLKIQRSLTGLGTWTDVCTAASTSINCSFNTTTLPDNRYDIRMLATDQAGNATSNSAQTLVANVIIDNFGPTVSVDDPGPWLRGNPQVITATATDLGAGVNSVQIQYQLSSATTWTNCGAADTTTPYQCSLNTTTLTSGAAYNFRATATDKATTVHSTTSAVLTNRVVDNTAPTATLTAPASPLSATVAFSATGSDTGSGVATLAIQRSPTGAGTWTDICAGTATTLSCPAIDTLTIDDGRYDFRAWASDAAGNTGASTTASNRAIDNQPPTVTMTTPSAPLLGAVTLQSTATDAGTGVTSVQYQYSPAGAGTWTTACTGATTPFSCTMNTGLLADGSYDVQAIATDGASRTAVSAPVSGLVVDNTVATDVQLANATGTAGRADVGDTIALTTSKQLAPTSILAAWTGLGQAVVVRITNGTGGANDTLTFYNSANTAQLPLGTVNLGATTYVTASGRFNATMVQATTTITVTLGSLAAGTVATVAGNSTATWTPSTTATNLTGTRMLATAVSQSGGAKKLF
jgi:hypothetical protein